MGVYDKWGEEMSRLIDADELKKAVEDFPNCYNGWSDTYDKAFIIGAIEEAPTIDAVEVVRCRECKYWIDNSFEDDDLFRECRWRDDETTDEDDYCSYGEREGE